MEYLYLGYRIQLLIFEWQKDPPVLVGGQDNYIIIVSLLFMFFMLIRLLALN